ncbi:unnamed protein product [Pleuronectes platessa]|uniref:Uncharacterized protein n=1 Tax=Pleuronectes platessa TaxID=8262 RepID=A0A9N7VI18_PLEPL|nr:unnamed protein product [Pleuronectes platessa]
MSPSLIGAYPSALSPLHYVGLQNSRRERPTVAVMEWIGPVRQMCVSVTDVFWVSRLRWVTNTWRTGTSINQRNAFVHDHRKAANRRVIPVISGAYSSARIAPSSGLISLTSWECDSGVKEVRGGNRELKGKGDSGFSILLKDTSACGIGGDYDRTTNPLFTVVNRAAVVHWTGGAPGTGCNLCMVAIGRGSHSDRHLPFSANPFRTSSQDDKSYSPYRHSENELAKYGPRRDTRFHGGRSCLEFPWLMLGAEKEGGGWSCSRREEQDFIEEYSCNERGKRMQLSAAAFCGCSGASAAYNHRLSLYLLLSLQMQFISES